MTIIILIAIYIASVFLARYLMILAADNDSIDELFCVIYIFFPVLQQITILVVLVILFDEGILKPYKLEEKFKRSKFYKLGNRLYKWFFNIKD